MEPKFYTYTGDYRGYLRKDRIGPYTDSERAFYDSATEALDQAEALSVVEEPSQTFFRGMTASSFTSKVIADRAYADKAYSSTTYDLTTALSPLFNSPDADGFRTVMVLTKQAGESLLYINDVQREFLLPRGSAFNVTDIEEVLNLTVSSNFPLFFAPDSADNLTAVFEKVRFLYLEPVEARVVVAGGSWTCASKPGGVVAAITGWASWSAVIVMAVLAAVAVIFIGMTIVMCRMTKPAESSTSGGGGDYHKIAV